MTSINTFYLNKELDKRQAWVTTKNNDNKFETNKLGSDIFNNATNLKLINGICYSPNNTVSVLEEITTNNNIQYAPNDLIAMKIHSLFMSLLNNMNVVGVCDTEYSVYSAGLKYLLELNKIPFTQDYEIKILENNNTTSLHSIDFVIDNTHAFYINYIVNNLQRSSEYKLNDVNTLMQLESYVKLSGLKSFSCADIYQYNNKCVVTFRNGPRNYVNIELIPKVKFLNISDNVKNIIHVCRDISFQAMSKLGFVCSAVDYRQYILNTLIKSNTNISIKDWQEYPVVFNDVKNNKIINLGYIQVSNIINESLILRVLCKKQITMEDLLYLKHLCFTTSLPGIIINFVSNFGNGIQLIDCNENKLNITSPYLENFESEYSNTPYTNPKSFKRNRNIKNKRK